MRHFLWLLTLMTVMETSPVYSQQTVFRARAIATYNARGTMIRVYKMADPEDAGGLFWSGELFLSNSMMGGRFVASP